MLSISLRFRFIAVGKTRFLLYSTFLMKKAINTQIINTVSGIERYYEGK